VSELRPPVAPARPTPLRHDTDERIDPWFWLRERDDPEVLAYLEAENTYTRDTLARLAPLRSLLFDEIVGRVQETDTSAPVRRGPFEYFSRTIEGQQYAVHCRRPSGGGALPDPLAPPGSDPGETVILDENELAAGHDYFSVGDLAVDPGQDIAAYSIDVDGGERHELRFRTCPTAATPGAELTDVVGDVYYGVAWANDGATVFYTRPDAAMRPWQIWRHTLGTPVADDALVFQEEDERFYVGVGRTRSGRFVVISTSSKITSEVWLVDADAPAAPPVVVEPRAHGHEYHVEHQGGAGGDRLFVLTNAGGADNFALMATPASTTSTRSPASSWCPSAPKPSSGSGCCASGPRATSSTTT